MDTNQKTSKNVQVKNYYYRENQRNSLVFSLIFIAFIAIVFTKVSKTHEKVKGFHQDIHQLLMQSIEQNIALEKHLLVIENKLDKSLSALQKLQPTLESKTGQQNHKLESNSQTNSQPTEHKTKPEQPAKPTDQPQFDTSSTQ